MDGNLDYNKDKHEADLPEKQSKDKKNSFGERLRSLKLFKVATKNKKLFLALSLLGVLLVGSFSWVVLTKEKNTMVPNQDERPKLGAAVTLIDGIAKINNDGVWETLSKEATLNEGDQVMTDAASRMIITLDDGSIIRLDESSAVSLESLDADAVRINNEAGDVYARVVTSERSFTVQVDGTDYSALGTAFQTINDTSNKGVQVMQSSVKVEDEESNVDEGKQFFKLHANTDLTDKVTDVSVDELKNNGFMIWNLEQDKQNESFKDKLGFLSKIEEKTAEEPAPAPAAENASIKLSASTYEKGVSLKWTVANISGNEGFKIVRSKKTTTPTFGKDDAAYADGAGARSYNWKDTGGVSYTYRVCAYKSKACSTYSNAVTITSPYVPPEAVVPGTVTLSLSGTEASWSFTGTAPHGFKVNIDPDPSPVYGSSYKSIYAGSSPQNIEGLTAGTYYVRVCKYTADSNISGGCTDYSNEETLIVP